MNTATVETALERLQKVTNENPGIQEAAWFYQHLIPAINALLKEVPDLSIDQQALRQKLAAGVPLLVNEPLEFDAIQSRRIMETLSEATSAGDASGSMGQKARDILVAIKTGALDPLNLLPAVAKNEAGPVEETADRLGLDSPMLMLLAQNTLKVYLRAWREKLEPAVDLAGWHRNQCPFCGADPAIAEIRGVEAARYLRCLHCGAGWPYPNLRCAFCGNEDHKTLGILLVDSEPRKYYVHTCERCNHYIKTLISFEPLTVDLLFIEDLATLSLDGLAAEKGYKK